MSITNTIYVICRTATHTHTIQHNRQDEQRNMGSEAHDLDFYLINPNTTLLKLQNHKKQL